jgi:carboxypeptidase T
LTTSLGFRAAGYEAPSPQGYHDWNSASAELEQLNADFGKLTQYRSVGTTFEGREIPALNAFGGSRQPRRVMVVGGHHAREWISVEVPLAFAMRIVRGQQPDAERRLLAEFDFTFVPMLNPDGHFYSMSPSTRLWRKNRREDDDYNIGVDLNRNYSMNWGCGFASKEPLSDMYRGGSAFSEAETSALRALFQAIKPDLLLSYHCYGEEVLYPWAFDPFSGADAALQAGKDLAEAYAAGTGLTGDRYVARSLRDHYGVGVGGELGDWALVESQGSCIPLTIELSPNGGNPGFMLPSSAISGVVAQNWDGLLKCLETLQRIRPARGENGYG